MKLSQGTDIAKEICKENNPFVTLKKIVYDACDYGEPCSMFADRVPIYFADEDKFAKYFEEQYRLAQEAGIEIGQVHAPSHTYKYNDFSQDEINEGLRRAIIATSVMHSPYLVIHPAQPMEWADDTNPEYTKEVNYGIFSSLIPVAKENGVILALENMPSHTHHIPCSSVEEWRDYVDMMNSDWFAACMDTGHANMARNYTDMPVRYEVDDYIKIMGNRIRCIHVHDNDGHGDDHTIPGTCTTGNMRWKPLLLSLKEIGYKGTFNLESDFSIRLPESIRIEAEQFQHNLVRAMMSEMGV